MPFASSSAGRVLRARYVPLATVAAVSVTLYGAHLYTGPIRNDDGEIDSLATSVKKQKTTIAAAASPFAPLGWGSNKYLTLSPDASIGQVKRPTPITQLGSTPLRHLVIEEKYGAAVDARGDLWMWGAGYDPSGSVGRSLRGKKLATLSPGPAKLFGLSKDGRLYVVSSDRAFQDSKQHKSERSWWTYMFGTRPGVDFVELQAENGLKWGERWADVSVGRHHLLAVTNKGRTFSLPLSPAANSHRQLGTRQIFDIPYPVPNSAASAIPMLASLPPESDPRFATVLSEIPSLHGVTIKQVATSERTSFVRTPAGRVLGFGANESGQIGLGGSAIVDIVPTPVEIVLAKAYSSGSAVKCIDVAAGGGTTLFTVERTVAGRGETFVDLLACGNGISGALGNGLWSSAASTPSRVKTVSGLQEYSEKAQAFLPLSIYNVSISSSPSVHAFAVLDTVSEADQTGVKKGLYGKDVMVWGGNADYQLGNGKRSSLAVPQHLPPLAPKAIDALSTSPAALESSISSGTLSPMPHSRLQLRQNKADAYDLFGKLIKRRVRVEETVVAGYNASVLYNKIID